MATFETQVEALTGISISGSSNPTQTELSAFLVDGVKDVIHRMIEVRPEELVRFTSTTNSTSSIAKVGKILSVVRKHDSTTILRKCTAIDPGDRYDATDTESLNYRSKINPGYYELAGLIHTVPEAGSGNNDIVVTQLYYDTGVAYGDEVPDNFPESYAYLVAKYAAIQSLKAKMSNSIISITAVPPDVPTLTSVTFSSVGGDVDASLPTYTTETVSAGDVFGSSTAPVYTAPTTTISGIAWATEYPDGEVDLTTPLAAIVTNVDLANSVIDSIPVPPDVPPLTSITYTDPGATDASLTIVAAGGVLGSSTQPSYNDSVASAAFTLVTGTIVEANNFIDSDEDVELATAKLSEVQAKINEANLIMQNELNEFNEENIKYQASVQESMAEFQSQNQINLQNAANSNNRLLQKAVQDAKVILDNNAQSIQKYQAEISEYQAEIGAMSAQSQGYLSTAQGYVAEINTRLSITQAKISEYQAKAQDSLQEFNEDNAAFQANIQEAMQEIQVANQVNIAAAQGELQLNMDNENRSQQRQLQNSVNDMQAIVANNDDLIGKFSAETAEYQAEVGTEVQEKTTKMQQYKVLHDQLLLDYNFAFGVPGAGE